MALDPARGFPNAKHVHALLELLNEIAFTDAVADEQGWFRDAPAVDLPSLRVTIDETVVKVNAMTRTLRSSRELALVDAEEMVSSVVATGGWALRNAPTVVLHPDLDSLEDAQWCAALVIELVIASRRETGRDSGFPEGTPLAG